jgi:hypothetical protein
MSSVQSYLSVSGSAVAQRMEEMRQKEAHDKEAAAKKEALDKEAAAKKLTELQHAIEIASVDWEAELLFDVEKAPKLLDAVRSIILSGIQQWCRYPSTYLPGTMIKVATATDPIPVALAHPKAGMLLEINRLCVYRGGEHHHITCSCTLCVHKKAPCLLCPQGRKHPTITSIVELATILHDSCDIVKGIQAIQQGLVEDHIPKEVTLINERGRLRIRILTRIFHSLQTQARAEARVKAQEAARIAAEEARIVVEKEAARYQAFLDRRKPIFEHYNKGVLATLRTPFHNFVRADEKNNPIHYVQYFDKETPKRCNFIYIRLDPMESCMAVSHITPHTFPVPMEWNGQYKSQQIPFLPQCPVCRAQTRLILNGQIVSDVRCPCERYRWDPATNLHYKFLALWDPKDPDGSKTKKAAKDKQIAEKEEQIRKLQEELMYLRTS